ncbi:hypothetical protein N657DRAFT_284459 [Parathielavia appendiculata]|uniref:Uncharacterized protein n=1 Tax=Parathielavia appendiculata TaxID=2587402 RepID=A0AAN6U3Z1_9PEZI|nr:hypothetical protein N657DRAFT_284459 [Parathielavia appendiculata]
MPPGLEVSNPSTLNLRLIIFFFSLFARALAGLETTTSDKHTRRMSSIREFHVRVVLMCIHPAVLQLTGQSRGSHGSASEGDDWWAARADQEFSAARLILSFFLSFSNFAPSLPASRPLGSPVEIQIRCGLLPCKPRRQHGCTAAPPPPAFAPSSTRTK